MTKLIKIMWYIKYWLNFKKKPNLTKIQISNYKMMSITNLIKVLFNLQGIVIKWNNLRFNQKEQTKEQTRKKNCITINVTMTTCIQRNSLDVLMKMRWDTYELSLSSVIL